VYNWAKHIPTFLWELINDTNTSEGNDFGIVNGKLLEPTDFKPKPVFYTIERTNALLADTVPDSTIGISVVDQSALHTTKDAPFFSYGFRSHSGKSIVAYWLGAKIVVGHTSQPAFVKLALRNSGIEHPVLIDIDADTIIPLNWQGSGAEKVLRVPVRDSVVAIGDASYFDWASLPEAPAGLVATLNGGAVDLKWQASEGASSFIIEARSAPSNQWVEVKHLPAGATNDEVKKEGLTGQVSFRICSVNAAGRSAYSNIAYVGEQ
jgi:hypothetical protein